MTRWFITLPTFDTPTDAMDWCEQNGVVEPRLQRGDDGRIRGRGERVENEAQQSERR